MLKVLVIKVPNWKCERHEMRLKEKETQKPLMAESWSFKNPLTTA